MQLFFFIYNIEQIRGFFNIVIDFHWTSIKRLTLTAATEVKIFADGYYVGKTNNWDYPYVVDISASTTVRSVLV